MTARVLPAAALGDGAGTAPAGQGPVPPTGPAGATNWAALCLIAEFAQAVGAPLPTDRRGGKGGTGHARRLVVLTQSGLPARAGLGLDAACPRRTPQT